MKVQIMVTYSMINKNTGDDSLAVQYLITTDKGILVVPVRPELEGVVELIEHLESEHSDKLHYLTPEELAGVMVDVAQILDVTAPLSRPANAAATPHAVGE